jgi:hypothetical protein
MRIRPTINWLVGGVLATVGCSSAPERPANIDDEVIAISGVDAVLDREGTLASDEECAADGSRTCAIDLGVHADIHDCVAGTQVCESGRWSRCYPNP